MADEKHYEEEELLENAIPIPPEEDEDETPVMEIVPEDPVQKKPQISSFAEKERRKIVWKRAPIKTGTGACHVKTFVTKLRLDAIDHIDEQVNEWLDENPEYEVKFVTTAVGRMVGKTTEDALIMSVWV